MNHKTRLERFIGETHQKGYSGLLPVNLSDAWLDLLLKQAEEIIAGDEGSHVADELVATVILLLQQKKEGVSEAAFSLEEIFDHIECLAVELRMELMSRRTDFSYLPATLDTILADRKVEVWSKAPSR